MKNKDLISQMKQLQKSLDIAKGHKLLLYKTEYTVMDTNNKFTFLRDPNGHPVALPTKKLKQIITRSMKKSLEKALNMGKGPGSIVPSAGKGGGVDKMHAGMIRVDKVDSKGRKYHYWVHSEHGTRHEAPSEGSKQETHLHEEDQKLHGKMLDAIHKHAHPEDVEKISKKLDNWIEKKSAYSHLKEAHSQLARETGGVPTSTVNNIAAKQAEHLKAFEQLKSSLASSAKKKRG